MQNTDALWHQLDVALNCIDTDVLFWNEWKELLKTFKIPLSRCPLSELIQSTIYITRFLGIILATVLAWLWAVINFQLFRALIVILR